MDLDYFDLTISDNVISRLLIKRRDNYNCALIDHDGIIYKGFILAKSNSLNAFTVCDINFQKSDKDKKYQPRLIFRRTDEKFKDRNVKKGAKCVRISFLTGEDGYREFWKMIAFLHNFKELVDLGDFDNTYRVIDKDAFILEFKNQNEVEKINDLSQLILYGGLTEDNVKEALKDPRKNTIKEFEKLLKNKNYWEEYQEKHSEELNGKGEEAVWHYFLKRNSWVLGLNADIRFLRDILSEVEVGTSDSTGSGNPKVDFLGISDYTVLIELKTPNTPIFTQTKKNTSRTNTWSFTDDFIDGTSQCLAQKCDWDKSHKQKNLVNVNNEIIDQNQSRTVDPKTIFLIGNKFFEMPKDSKNVDDYTKRDTFERFRRNNRNLDIITFDELFERAYYIVYNKKPL